MTSRNVDDQSGRDATDAARQLRADPAPLPQPSDATELVEAIHAALCDYRMSNMGDEDECPYPLVDLCSNDGTTIDTGRAELFSLANYLVSDERVATFITQAQARATAAEGERDELKRLTRNERENLTATIGHLQNAASGWEARANAAEAALRKPSSAQQTITQLTRELETARKVLEQAMDSRAPDLADATFPGWSTRAASFLSSLPHQDEQG